MTDDPRAQTGAYILHMRRLYRVVSHTPGAGPNAGTFIVENALNGYEERITEPEMRAAELIRQAPTLDLTALPEAPEPALTKLHG